MEFSGCQPRFNIHGNDGIQVVIIKQTQTHLPVHLISKYTITYVIVAFRLEKCIKSLNFRECAQKYVTHLLFKMLCPSTDNHFIILKEKEKKVKGKVTNLKKGKKETG
jgi:hypothetical protein